MSVPADSERDLVILACAVSAGIHAALTPQHFHDGVATGTGFLIAAVLIAGLAVALTHREGPVLLVLTILVFTSVIAGYALAVTTGLPVLHPDPEPVAGVAVTTKVVEALGLACAADLLWRGRPAVAVTSLEPKGTT